MLWQDQMPNDKHGPKLVILITATISSKTKPLVQVFRGQCWLQIANWLFRDSSWQNICCLCSSSRVLFVIFESRNMAFSSFPAWSAIDIGRLCSQINLVNSNAAFMTFSSRAEVLSEEGKLVIFCDDFDAFTDSKCFFNSKCFFTSLSPLWPILKSVLHVLEIVSPWVDCLRKGYWALHLSVWLVNFTKYFF